MNRFIITYSFSNLAACFFDSPPEFGGPELFTTTIEAETLTEALSYFYDPTTTTGVEWDTVPTIHNIETYYNAREIVNDNTRLYLNTGYEQTETHGLRAMYDQDKKQWYITGSMYDANKAYWDVQGISIPNTERN
jgi:hypothetical protein